jgi:hypothetical protein
LRKLGRRLKVSEAIAFEKQARVAFYFDASSPLIVPNSGTVVEFAHL